VGGVWAFQNYDFLLADVRAGAWFASLGNEAPGERAGRSACATEIGCGDGWLGGSC